MDKTLVVQVDEATFGIAISNVLSIEKTTTPTLVPLMPEYVLGIVDLRGKVIPVVDTNQLLFNKNSEITDSTRLILVETVDMTIALMVDEAKEIITIHTEDIRSVESVKHGQLSNVFDGVLSFNEKLITLIDIEKLLQSLTNLDLIKNKLEDEVSL